MTNDSELKRQIIEKLAWEFGVDEGHSAQKIFLAIVDAAKKEFPKSHNQPFIDGDGDEWNNEIYNYQEITEWFKKWFGPAEVKNK